MALNRKNLYSLLKEAIQTINPVGGVTMTDILKFAKYKGDWDKEKLKTAMTKMIKSNLRDDKLKKVGYRYRMNVLVYDDNSKLCGTCGAKTMKGKRKGSKKCIKLVIRKHKRKTSKKRKSRRKHKCGKSRRRKHKSRRKRKSKCKRKGRRGKKSKGKGKKRRLTGTACILSCLKKNNLMKKKMKKKRKSRRSKSKCKSRPAEHETKQHQKPVEGIPEQQQN